LCAVALLAFSNVLLRDPSASAHLKASSTRDASETAANPDYHAAKTVTSAGSFPSFTVAATSIDNPPDPLGYVSSVTPIDGGGLHFDGGTDGNKWDVQQGKAYKITLTNVLDAANGGTDPSMEVMVKSSSANNSNQCFTATKVSTGVYEFTISMPATACNTYPILYGTTACAPNSGLKALSIPTNDKATHLRAATFDDSGNYVGSDVDCNAPDPVINECVISCPQDVTVECGASTEPSATGTPTVTGDCVAEHTDSFAPACGNTGVITRTWTVTNANNVTASCDQKITIVDTTVPTIGNAGPSGTSECPNTPVFTPPSASDTCGEAEVIEDSDITTPGSCPNTYSRTKTWHAKDACGNSSGTVSQTITVVDTTAPTITAAGPNAIIECPATPAFTAPTASDTCGGAEVIEDSDVTVPGSCPGSYSRTKTWHAKDACGNTSAPVNQTITVVDTTPPTIGDAGANTTIYCPSQPAFTPPASTDSCSTATVIEVSDVTTQGSCGTYSRTKTWQAKDLCGNLSPTRSQTVVVECNNCGEGTIGYWQNKNGQAQITGAGPSSGTCNLTPYLRGYAPFENLSATANCGAVASYVTTVVKSASSSGAAMNAMLKAQMLSTALDVYFIKVNGDAPIDLTYINKAIGSTNYENVSSSFEGASCKTIKNMLLYAATQSNSGGSLWYGQVKSGLGSQELAKDAFDAINNQKAFSVFSCP
jgi:hypothetical protein